MADTDINTIVSNIMYAALERQYLSKHSPTVITNNLPACMNAFAREKTFDSLRKAVANFYGNWGNAGHASSEIFIALGRAKEVPQHLRLRKS